MMKVFKLSSLAYKEFDVDSCKFFKILFEFYSFLQETSRDHEFSDSAYAWLRHLNTKLLIEFGAYITLPECVKDSISGFVNSNLSVRQKVMNDLSYHITKNFSCVSYETKAKRLMALGDILTNDLYDYDIEELVEGYRYSVAACSSVIADWRKSGFKNTYFSNP